MSTPSFFALAAVVGLASLLWIAQRKVRLTQYLFFLRYPVLAALALLVAPPGLRGSLVLGNLFVLDAPGIALVTALAGFVGSAIVYVFSVTFGLTPQRVKLAFFRSEDFARQETYHVHLERWHWCYVLGLITPLCIVLMIDTYDSRLAALCGVVIGITIGGTTYWVATRPFPGGPKGLVGVGAKWVQSGASILLRLERMTRLRGTLAEGFMDARGRIDDVHARAIVFVGVSLVLYGIGYFALRMRVGGLDLTTYTPALLFVLLLLMMLTLLLGGIAFYFDAFRIPSLVPLLVLSVISYSVFARDHYFPLISADDSGTSISASTQPCSLPPETAVQAWAGRHSEKPKALVLVAASGGGITASLWTARVLTGLSDPHTGLGDDFARSVAMISSVSGGGVGAAYFVDAFTKDAPVIMSSAARERVVRAAGTSSLNQTAFAIAYNDLLAVFLPFLTTETSPDRGWALETVWRRHMLDQHASLRSWRTGVREGWRPTQIFNATIAETGGRLLLTPIDCPTGACSGKQESRWRAISFAELEAPGDLDVITAARLSATFPWVTPLSRQPGAKGGYHIADGGYYDNFGVITVLEWLSRVHSKLDLSKTAEKVILVQIRAARSCVRRPKQNSGWLYATLGPLVTMLNVRNTSQRNTNEAAIAALKALLDQSEPRVAFETVTFELDRESPLSWHLSGTERENVKEAWDGAVIERERARLSCLWKSPAELWTTACSTSAPADLKRPDAAAQVFEEAHERAENPTAQVIDPKECTD